MRARGVLGVILPEACKAQVAALAPVIRAYVAEAMGYADAGVVPVKEEADLELPEALVTALDADPGYAEAHSNLAFLQTSEGQFELAAQSARRAIDLNPQFADAYLNLAEAQFRQGKTQHSSSV